MTITLIAAVDERGGIGKNGKIPWRLPADMRHFKELTLGKPVIMGWKTFESIGKALPERKNIVLTEDASFRGEEAIPVHSVEEALAAAAPAEEVMIIGGGATYQQFLPLAKRMYLTRIHSVFDADTFFPEFNADEWRETERVDHPADEKNPSAFTFLTLEKI